jgi:hypothetical protein
MSNQLQQLKGKNFIFQLFFFKINSNPFFKFLLIEIFADIPEEMLQNILQICGNNLEITINTIFQMLNNEEQKQTPKVDIKQGIVKIYGESSERNCGYCDKTGGVSYGLTISKLTCEEYQKLIDRNWRRSGTYIYQPTNKTTCTSLFIILNFNHHLLKETNNK